MGFRTILIQSPCKLNYKDGFLILRGNDIKMIHISEIHTLILDSTMTTVTGYLLCELMKEKVNVIFCDEARNPIGELHPCYGSHDSSGRVLEQTKWTEERKAALWQSLIRCKINNQSRLLRMKDPAASNLLDSFANELLPGDKTNREGHAAKVYFNRIFGPEFTRNVKNDRNAALNYGYAILLSTFNKEITARGYITQLGIHHRNALNDFNLASDLMEPFRGLVDRTVYFKDDIPFDKEYKYRLLDVLNEDVRYENHNMTVTTAITKYVRNATDYLSGRIDWNESMVLNVEAETYASNDSV